MTAIVGSAWSAASVALSFSAALPSRQTAPLLAQLRAAQRLADATGPTDTTH